MTSEIEAIRAEAQQQTGELVRRLREYCRSQKEVWRLVPWLALQADGRTGHLDQYSTAFRCGYWVLPARSGSSYTTEVDLATGEIVDVWRPDRLASDQQLISLIHHPECVDAEMIVAELKKEGCKKTGRYYSAKSKREWRAEVIADTNLQKCYVRTQHFPAQIYLD